MAATATPARFGQDGGNNNPHYQGQPGGPSPTETYTFNKGVYTTTTTTQQTPPSAGLSPTGFQLPAAVRHIRQPRQPMYVPAALRPADYRFARPTDIPPRPSALDTPPTSSEENSYDGAKRGSLIQSPATSAASNKSRRRGDSRNSNTLPQDGSVSDNSGGGDGGSSSSSSTIDASSWDTLRRGLSRAASESLDIEPGEVTGPPTSAHWKPDAAASSCGVCLTTFSWYLRRHHCRRCGDVVCSTHSSAAVPLDQHARFHPGGLQSRACDPCAREWKLYQHLRSARPKTEDGRIERRDTDDSTATAPARPIPHGQSRLLEDARVGSMARSEGGMIWSTF